MATGGQPRRSTARGQTNIARRRVEHSITQRQAAAAAGVPYWTYRRLETGELRDPSISTVVNVALAFRYPDEDLWDCLGQLWDDGWPQPEWLTSDEVTGAKKVRTRLRAVRESAGITQEAIASELGISVRAYRSLEGGTQQSPRLSKLVRAANLLGVSLHEVCEERWLGWTVVRGVGSEAPGDLDGLRAKSATLLPPKWA